MPDLPGKGKAMKKGKEEPKELKNFLETVFSNFHKRKYIHPDPLEFLHDRPRLQDREITGLVASLLAFGRVEKILQSVSKILSVMGRDPYEFISGCREKDLRSMFDGFKYRFVTGRDISHLLLGAQKHSQITV